MRHATLLLAPLLLAVAACATADPVPVPSAVVSPSGTPVVASPSAAPTAAPPASPAPVATPAATPAPSQSPATPAPDPAFTPEEAALLAQLRPDARQDCTPRRRDLPKDAVAGVECRPDDALVARVGIYRFEAANEWVSARNVAAYTYMTRMAEAGVDVNAGDCDRDVPGERPWGPDGDGGDLSDPTLFNWENAILSPDRIGCFGDENGTANVRLTCGDGTYVGVLGRRGDLSELSDWTQRFPEGQAPGTGDGEPGLCVAPAAG